MKNKCRYIAEINHNNHQFFKIDKSELNPLFKKAIKTMREAATKKLSISELVRQMLILSRNTKSKKDLEFMETLVYFITVAERK